MSPQEKATATVDPLTYWDNRMSQMGPGPLTSIALEREPVESSTPSGRYDALSVEAGDLALRHGALQARTSQLSALVDELLENLGQIRFDCPKLLERVRLANEAAKVASGL